MYYLSYYALKKAKDGGGASAVLTGNSDPNDAVTGQKQGQLYVQLEDNKIISMWVFQGTPGTKGPWITFS